MEERQTQLTNRSLALSKTLALVAVVFPVLAVVGWIFNIPLLRQVHPTLPVMHPNTALGLLLLAAGILLTRNQKHSRTRVIAACALAAGAWVLGLLSLSEYIFVKDLGIDRIFFGHASIPPEPYPGRSSPQTATNFLLFGAALLVYNVPFLQARVGQILALSAGANAVITVTGYIFSTKEFYGFPEFGTGMALHTAAAFILMTASLLLSRPNEGMMALVTSGTRSGAMARQIFLTGVLGPPLVGLLTWIGTLANWYGLTVQISLFVVAMGVLVFRTTWQAARQAEGAELRAHAALEESQAINDRLRNVLDERRIFAALIDNSSDFIGIADPSGKPIYVNPAGRRMIGVPEDYPIERTQISEAYAPNERAFASEVILKAMLEQGQWRGETYFWNARTEQAIPVSDEHFLIRDNETGRLLGMGTVTRDISDIRRAQQEAQRAINIRDEVLAIVSHDLKNPVTTISLVAQWLRSCRGMEASQLETAAVKIERAVQKMLLLISDLLDLSKIRSGTLSVEFRPVGVDGLLMPVIESMRTQAEARRQTIDLNIASGLPLVWADPDRIGQVMSNLLGNAIKFSPEDSKILVSAVQETDCVVIGVSDRGPGIPPEYLQKVFDRYWQATEAKGVGSGLGLSIAKGIVNAHCGKIWAESQPGKGSCFYFTLPLAGIAAKRPDVAA
jgi:PAS domain S-box-containing protein